MRAFSAIGRLCFAEWKDVLFWALLGPLLFVVYGAGSGTGDASAWAALVAVGVLFGAFVGALIQVGERRGKKNQSLQPLDHDVRNLSERELHVAFSLTGAALGILFALLLSLPPIGYPICAGMLVLIGLSRPKIEQLIP